MSDSAAAELIFRPDFASWQRQAVTINLAQGSSLNPEVDATTCSAIHELRNMTKSRFGPGGKPFVFERPAFGPKYSVLDNHVVLYNSSEIIYKVPRNTSLVQVLGPVGNHSAWIGNSECYATFSPRPPWWMESSFPLSTSRKLIEGTDQTMFFLPIPPNIEYTLRVGGLGQDTSCPVSGIRTYPHSL